MQRQQILGGLVLLAAAKALRRDEAQFKWEQGIA